MTLSDHIFKVLAEAGISETYESWYKQDIDQTHLIFQQMSETPADYSDGHYETLIHDYRFDVFSEDLNAAEQMKKEVRAALEAAGFIWQGTQYEYDSKIRYYHNSSKYLLEEVAN